MAPTALTDRSVRARRPRADAALRPLIPPSKFAPPLPPATRVERADLTARICRSFAGRVTVLRAPTGFGKTTLLQACCESLRSAGVRVAWVTLDASDNDASRLVHCLANALANAVPGLVRLADPESHNLPAAEAAAELFGRLPGASSPLAVLLDDFEELHDEAALQRITGLIDHLPAGSGVVLASRKVPDLPLSRLRAGGRLVEIDQASLRFSEHDAETLLNAQRGLALTGADVARLHGRTEGWPAGLWLASVALERTEDRRAFIDGFSGSYATVADYLGECVLARQSEQVRSFLLRTSILAQVSAPLCEALMPGIDAQALLQQLAQADVPLAALEGDSRWYRYHGMFAAFLRSILDRECGDEVGELHRRAAHWYEQQNRPVPAISHALQGGDVAHAVALLKRHSRPLMKQGRSRLLQRWLSALPASALQSAPWLQSLHLWTTIYTFGAKAATTLFERYALEHCDDENVQADIRPLRPLMLALMDRVEESTSVGLQILAQRPQLRGFSDAVLCCTVASVLVNLGDYEQGRRLLEQAKRAEGGELSAFTVMHCETAEATIDAQEARLRQAFGRLRLAVDASRRDGNVRSAGNAWAGVLHACALYEMGEIATAEPLLRAHAPAIHALGMADMLILVYRCLAQIAFARGQADDAYQALSELEYLGHQRDLQRVVASAKLERSRLLLRQGHRDAADIELRRAADFPGLWERVALTRLMGNEGEDLAIGQLRWSACGPDAGTAVAAIDAAIAQATGARRNSRALKLSLLRAIALAGAGRAGEALGAVEALLRSTAPEGFVQMFADEGAPASTLLRQFAETATGRRAAMDPLVGEHLKRVLQACGAGTATAAGPCPAAPIEALTRKELAVLELVATGLGDSMIAEKLFLSLSTVRTHLRNVYGKLSVHSRMQAVVAARDLGLI